jgi:hypothetical protein
MRITNAIRAILLAGCPLFGFLLIGSFATERRPISASVCSICSNPEHYSSKLVTVSGYLEGDGMHGTAIVDRRCPAYGLAISASEPYKGEEEVKGALRKGHPGTLDKTISGIFIGQFLWKPNEMIKRVLILKEVRDITTVTK